MRQKEMLTQLLIFCQDRKTFIRRDDATIVLIIVLLIFENVFYLEKSVLSCVIFHLKLLHLYDFQACKYQLKYQLGNMVCSGCGMFRMWDIGDVVCSGSGIFWMWDVRDADVRDVGCSGCGMFRMQDVGDVVRLGCGMFEMWDVGDVVCSGCGMFRMRDVRDVGCGMWDVCRDVGCSFTK